MINNQGDKGMPFKPILPNFWSIIKKDKKTSIIIHTGKLIDFCSKIGYYNYIDYTGKPILVKNVGNVIQEARIPEVKQSIKNYLRNGVKLENVWSEFAKSNIINENFIHLIEKLPEVDFNVSKKGKAFFFYKNGVVCISDGGYELIPYNQFPGLVWQQQIKNRDFHDRGMEYKNAVFNSFLKRICNNVPERYDSLCTIAGYLLHPYKDPTLTKAVLLLDEDMDFSGEAKGGTGKSLFAKGLEQITTMVIKDGKNFNSNETFVYDDIRLHHRLLYFDDVKPTFQLEFFYSFISGSIKVNRKYMDSLTIPASLAPKLLISSNYYVRGTGGETDKRRRIEFEIAPYFSMKHTPFDEFGHIFFDDWDDNEWQLFDNLMMRLVHSFIKNGIIEPPQINIAENKLKFATHPEYVMYMDNKIELNIPYDKAQLIDEYKRSSPSQRNLSSHSFKLWIDVWAEGRNLIAKHFKSNGRAMVIFSNKS